MNIETEDSPDRVKAMFVKAAKRLGIKQMRTVVRNLKKKDRGNMSLKQSGSLGPYYDIFVKSKFYKSLTVENLNNKMNEALTGLEQVEEEVEEEVKVVEDEIEKTEECEIEQELVLHNQEDGAEDSDDETAAELQGVIDTLKHKLRLYKAKYRRLKDELSITNDTIRRLINN